jgi:hypothetical protein
MMEFEIVPVEESDNALQGFAAIAIVRGRRAGDVEKRIVVAYGYARDCVQGMLDAWRASMLAAPDNKEAGQ